jgi:chloramphenicol O-acetyltransferase
LPHHGEGWGMPIHDAVNHQNFIITTQFGGITEWLNSKNSFIINHSKSSVFEMNWNPWYSSYQSWANPSLSDLKNKMRSCYSDRKSFEYKKRNLAQLHNIFSINQCSFNLENILSKERFKRFI